jgi:hypothetical protein
VPLEIPFLLFGIELEKICWRMYLNSISISQQPFRLICSLPDVIYIGNLWHYIAYSCATSKLGISLLSLSLFQVVVDRRVFRKKKTGSDMKQRDSDHRKTSCHAFIRGVINFSTKIWDEATRNYINGF